MNDCFKAALSHGLLGVTLVVWETDSTPTPWASWESDLMSGVATEATWMRFPLGEILSMKAQVS